MEMKKVTVSTVSTRKFVEGLLYLGSLGGELTEQCVTVKGMFLRAEVMLPVDTPVKENQEIKVSPGLPVVKKEDQSTEDKDATSKAKKTARKTAKKVEEKTPEPDVEESEQEVKED